MGRRNAGIERVVGVCLCQPAELERVFATVVKLSDALKSYWISSGNAAAAERCKRDFEKASSGDPDYRG